MKKIGIILTPDNRSKAYLQKIILNNIKLSSIIFMNDGRCDKEFNYEGKNIAAHYGFDISESIKDTLKRHRIDHYEFKFVDINHPLLIEHLKKSNVDFFIFTGGGRLQSDVLKAGPKFIHLHPGIVPEYRGSTCFYYSMINEDRCGVTAFVMNEGLDTGPIVYQRFFPKPNHIFVDEIYDPYIRSETLLDVLKNNMLKDKIVTQKTQEGNTYFIIHPVLKHIAILSCVNEASSINPLQ